MLRRFCVRSGGFSRMPTAAATGSIFDTNILLDVLLDREPHVQASAAAWRLSRRESRKAHAITTIHCLVRREPGNLKATRTVSAILSVFEVGAVDSAVILEALQLPLSDFDDAVTAAVARLAVCECIVTRDPKGFRGSPVRALMPEAVMPLLS